MGCEGKRAESEEKGNSSLSIVVSIEQLESILEEKKFSEETKLTYTIPDFEFITNSVDSEFKHTYTPKFVSIGPNFKEDVPQDPKELKQYYLHKLFWRGRQDRSAVEAELHDAYGEVMKMIKEAQKCYATKIKLEDEEFATMLVLDGSFIVEHLINYNLGVDEPRLWSNEWDPKQLKEDLVMLGNQVPFFILEILFNHVKEVKEGEFEFREGPDVTRSQILQSMVLWYLTLDDMRVDPKTISKEKTVGHMLHLLHRYGKREPKDEKNVSVVSSTMVSAVKNNLFRCGQMSGDEANNKQLDVLLRVFLEIVLSPLRLMLYLILGALGKLLYFVVLLPVAHIFWWRGWPRIDIFPSAKQLRKMMIHVEKQEEKRDGWFWDVRLQDSKLIMSKVNINGYAETLLQNLVLFESKLSRKQYVSEYANFLQHFVRTEEDMAILQAAGVLDSNLATDNLIKFFNSLCKSGSLRREDPEPNQVTKLFKDLKLHYSDPAHIWWGQALTKYLSSPWTIIAMSIAGVEFIQAIADLRGKAKHKEY